MSRTRCSFRRIGHLQGRVLRRVLATTLVVIAASIPTVRADAAPAPIDFRVNFQPEGAYIPTGYTPDHGKAFDSIRKFGWSDLTGKPIDLIGNARDRGVVRDQRLDTFIHMQLADQSPGVHMQGAWERAVANGTYEVSVGVGDPSHTDSRHVINLEHNKVIDFSPTAETKTRIVTTRITVTDGRLTVDAAGGWNTKINFLYMRTLSSSTPALTTTTMIIPTTTTTGPTTIVIPRTTTTTGPTTTAPSTTTTTMRTTTTTTASARSGPWALVFNDDFNTNVNEGGFLDAYGAKWDAYQWGWHDTSRRGSYDPRILSVNNGVMNMRLHTTADGVHHVAAPMPRMDNGSNMLYGRYEVRFRADAVSGYKTAWLLWPQSEVWPRDGEIDFPEGDLDGTIAGFMHRQGGTSGGDQDVFETGAKFTDWHTAVIEWMPGRLNMFMDDRLIGTSTERVPNTPMHWVLQTETKLDGEVPNHTFGNVQVDKVSIWKYNP